MFYSLLAALAAIGFFASLVCNILGWMHMDPPYGRSVFWLHGGALALGFALAYFADKTRAKPPGRDNLSHLFAELPRWVNPGITLIFFYALVDLAWSMYCIIHFYPNGKEQPMWLPVRFFSGIWMLFFGLEWAGFTGLARLSRRRNEQIQRSL